MSAKGLLIDVTLCEGCGECVAACRAANGLPETDAPEEVRELSATSYCALEPHGDRVVRKMCMHCESPTCASVCPVGAFVKTPEGAVVWDEERCIGCRYCMVACPFSVPKYEWSSANPKVRKCVFCHARQKAGQPPACAEACPAEATIWGDRADLLKQAHARIAENPDTYKDTVFGETVVGGTSMLFIGDLTPREMGFPADLPSSPLRELTHRVMSKIPGAVLVGGAFLLGMNWLTRRKNEIAALDAARNGGDSGWSSVASAPARPSGKERDRGIPRVCRKERDAAGRDATTRAAGAEFGDTLRDGER